MRGIFRVAKLPAGVCGVKDQVSQVRIQKDVCELLKVSQIFFYSLLIIYAIICIINLNLMGE